MTLVSLITLTLTSPDTGVPFLSCPQCLDRNIPKYILWHMNTRTSILIKMDKKVKIAAQKAAKEVGIPLSTILGAYLRQFAREQRGEFGPERMSKKMERELASIERDLKTGKNISPGFSSAKDAIAWLRSQ